MRGCPSLRALAHPASIKRLPYPRSVNRMIACNRRTCAFFCEEIPGYRELLSRLFDPVNPGS